jgi:hypothetical protein
LEGVALAALVGTLAMVLVYLPQIPERFVRDGFRITRPSGVMGMATAKNALWMVSFIASAAYLGLTLGARRGGLIHVPPEIERDSPHLHQMMFSVMIVMKAVLMLFSVYLVWALVNVGLHRGAGVSGSALTFFTLAVPVPLIYYTVKLRRYRR